jgi:hypothetical protein
VKPALEVADIYRRHGAAFRDAHGASLSSGQRRVMAAIEACRTAALGGHVEQCADCGETRIAYNSCRNRHCPKCQGLARAQWLADRQAELLPVPYFHLVFTMPAPLAAIALQNKALVYDMLFKAAAESVRVIAADPRHLGAETGMIAVLHTWGQTLVHHPHLHCIVPGGGLTPDGRWLTCRPGFFLSVRVLSRLYRRLSSSGCREHSMPARSSSSAISRRLPRRRHLPPICSHCGRPNGWSMPSGRLADLSTCSTTSAAIPIAWPSPTAALSASTTGRCGSAGKTTASPTASG